MAGNLKRTGRNWRASSPAAAVIPAPRVYASGAAAKTFVVGIAVCLPSCTTVARGQPLRYYSGRGASEEEMDRKQFPLGPVR